MSIDTRANIVGFFLVTVVCCIVGLGSFMVAKAIYKQDQMCKVIYLQDGHRVCVLDPAWGSFLFS